MRKAPGGAVVRIFRANPIAISILLIATRAWRAIASSVMSYSLKAPGLYFGPGCRVIGGRHISFGRQIFANRNLWLEAVTSYQSQQFSPTIAIGDGVSFSDDVHISSIESIVIGNNVMFGSRIFISDHSHGAYKGDLQSRPEEPPSQRRLGNGGPVSIGNNVWIGDNSVILGPATIGGGAIVGAHSVVRGIIPSNSMVAGSPARVIKRFNSRTGFWDKV